RKAIEAGVDIDMMSPSYIKNLRALVEEGTVSEELIDEAVWRILKLKNQLGLFENPYGGADEAKEKEIILCKEHRDAARKLAADSCVLLKNNGILPLQSDVKKIAVIGPYADNHDLLGIWAVHGDAKDSVTVRQGIENMIKAMKLDTEISSVKGSKFVRDASNIQCFGSSFEMEDESGFDEAALLNEAKEAAKEADVVILAVGEHFLQSGEGGSRGDIMLPDCQRELVKAVCEAGKPVVTLLFGGRPMDVRDLNEKSDALMMCWFPGTEGGNAIADLIFGKVNPSAKLTMSFPYCVGQVPVYYNAYHTGRPYRPEFNQTRFGSKYTDIPNDPLFPFGYGLSYTSFEYSDFELSADSMTSGETMMASCVVKNTGNLTGKEVVQFYIQDKVGSVVRPVKELKGFKKISLQAGEEKRVTFEITEDMLKFYTAQDKFEAEKGAFVAYIGKNSKECLEKEFHFN
ncbi:MAG: glycoside hydrolase family 3 C-terminal domain-containing protein, partial [Clostridiales bacterium]|nr:glycoside hydrolase family 3 C-terminal domain-containing protein [Clostridiales bacterium]